MLFRNSTMAAAANSSDKKRTGPGGVVPVDVSGHHSAETAHRDGGHEGRPVEIRQARPVRHQVAIRSRVTIQRSSTCPEGCSCASRNKAIQLRSCKSARTQTAERI